MKIDSGVIAQCYEDRAMTINGRTYEFLNVPHKSALQIIGIAQRIEDKSVMIGDEKWMQMEVLLRRFFSYDGDILAKVDHHFERYPEDYLTFIGYGIGMVSYPFTKGIVTG